MKISLIAAATENNVIGKDNDLPWNLPDDMKFFVQTTKGHHILMGRKNLESFEKLLPNRTNIVVTSNKGFHYGDAVVKHNIQDAIDYAQNRGENELMVIGGGEIYKQCQPFADKIYLTRIHTELEGDTYFPEIDMNEWVETSSNHHPKDSNHPYDFTIKTYERKKAD